ncbi:MAG: hypothetical protein R3E63_05205 [Pseudomonadales bacterium]
MQKPSIKTLALSFVQDYLPNKPVLALMAACEFSDQDNLQRACVTDQCDALQALLAQEKTLEDIASALQIAVLDFSRPLHLQPVFIPKPWGQEIWYTGIEERGVASVVSASGSTPLSWLLALSRQSVLGNQEQINLLKILDPLPDEVFGDLYFELHEKKREVYIVTHVDKKAWPDGVGAIRYGFSAEKRQLYSSDDAFLAAYKQSVSEYAKIRREIDAQLDVMRERDGIALNAPVSAGQLQSWLAQISVEMQIQEATLRKTMESFTALRNLREGDVLAVPLRTPHALQHGVRTVEFQTPVYERKILSFAQKVLTQAHWDTDAALQIAQLETPPDQSFPLLLDKDGVLLEQIVQFEDFIVQRLVLAAHAEYRCETAGSYVLAMTVVGSVDCAGSVLSAEKACLIPACLDSVLLKNASSNAATVLLARPL